MLKAVIFDMDGVLVDSEPLHLKTAVLTMKEYGVTITTDTLISFIGKTTTSMYETLKKTYQVTHSIDELLQTNDRIKSEIFQKEGYTPVPYTKELIQDLKQHGIKLAVASSSSMEDIQKVVKALHLAEYFDVLVTGHHVPQSKPEPDIFFKACEELQVRTDECVIIEDSKNGVIAASRAGIPAIGFINPNSGNQDLSKASILIEGFEEINTSFIKRVYLHAHNLPVTIATTKRLQIRELTMEDALQLYRFYQYQDIKENVCIFAPSYEEACQKLNAYIPAMYHFHGFGLWGVFETTTNRFVGHCGIELKELHDTMEYELGYAIHPDVQNQGYAKECCQAILSYAFDVLEIPSIVAMIPTTNNRSIQVAKSLHMKLEEVTTHLLYGDICVYRIVKTSTDTHDI